MRNNRSILRNMLIVNTSTTIKVSEYPHIYPHKIAVPIPSLSELNASLVVLFNTSINQTCGAPVMKSYFTRIMLLVALLLLTHTSTADTLHGRVVGVSDGDTVTVLDASNTQWKIRLMGIDAPEKKQAFGNKSKESLSALVFNKQVSVDFNKKDKYGRTVGKIIVNGVDANLEQIKAGLAWHYKKYQNEQSVDDRSIYAQAEEQARVEKRGLWLDTDPTPPWEWRKSKRKAAPSL